MLIIFVDSYLKAKRKNTPVGNCSGKQKVQKLQLIFGREYLISKKVHDMQQQATTDIKEGLLQRSNVPDIRSYNTRTTTFPPLGARPWKRFRFFFRIFSNHFPGCHCFLSWASIFGTTAQKAFKDWVQGHPTESSKEHCQRLPPVTGFTTKSQPEILHRIRPWEYYQSDRRGLIGQAVISKSTCGK